MILKCQIRTFLPQLDVMNKFVVVIKIIGVRYKASDGCENRTEVGVLL